jgi:hypothetical protein
MIESEEESIDRLMRGMSFSSSRLRFAFGSFLREDCRRHPEDPNNGQEAPSVCHRNEQMAEGTKLRVIIRESIHQ